MKNQQSNWSGGVCVCVCGGGLKASCLLELKKKNGGGEERK